MLGSRRARSPVRHLIIGGTEKAGTTSIFDWLVGHPETLPSVRKETNYFHEEYVGRPMEDGRRYAEYFRGPRSGRASLRIEASPVYLSEAPIVAPRVRQLLPDAKLVFVLREPTERLYSFYQFFRAKTFLPGSLTFEAFVDLCFEYERGTPADRYPIDTWYLRALRAGRYAEFLRFFLDDAEPGQVKVMFYDQLRENPRQFMVDLSAHAGIDPGFWGDRQFPKSNVTFSARRERLHRVAVAANASLEPALRRRPRIKRALVSVYKALNQSREGYVPIPEATRSRLQQFYASSIGDLRRIQGLPVPDHWAR